MKKALLITVAIILFSCLTFSLAEEKTSENIECPELDRFFNTFWYYNVNTIPDKLINYHENFIPEIRLYNSLSQQYEEPLSCEISLISENECLNDIFYIFIERSLIIFPIQFTEPGEAIFHCRLESDSYVFEKDYILNVYDYNEYPFINPPDEYPIFYVKPGEKIHEKNVIEYVDELINLQLSKTDVILPPSAKIQVSDILSSFYKTFENNEGVFYKDVNDGWVITDSGSGQLSTISYIFGNISIDIPITVHATNWSIAGPDKVMNGEKAVYQIEKAPDNMEFTFSVSGNAAVIDPVTGELTANNIEGSKKINIIANSNTGEISCIPVLIYDDSYSFTELVASFGTISGDPKINSEFQHWSDEGEWFFIYIPSTLPDWLEVKNLSQPLIFNTVKDKLLGTIDVTAAELYFISGDLHLKNVLQIDGQETAWLKLQDDKLTSPGEATFRLRAQVEDYYNEIEFTLQVLSWDDYPLFDLINPDGLAAVRIGDGPILENIGDISFKSSDQNTYLYSSEDLAVLTIKDHSAEIAEKLFSKEKYNQFINFIPLNYLNIRTYIYDFFPESSNSEQIWKGLIKETGKYAFQFNDYGEYSFYLFSPISNIRTQKPILTMVADPAADADFTLSSKDGSSVITAGNTLTVVASFANPNRINKQAKNDSLIWTVTDPSTGLVPDGLSIDKNGKLSAGKQISEVIHAEVKAESETFHTSAVFPVTVIPAMKKLSVEPAELQLYTGNDTAVTVRVIPDPETVPLNGITWTSGKKDMIEIIPDEENGTALIRALSAGQTTITVKEPGGKSAKVNVKILEPVQQIELILKGKPQPGKTITLSANILPKNAGNKKVEWSVDSENGIATINGNGQLKIDKNAEAGTVITVTCTAPGAPEPVTSKLEITVE